MHFFLGSQRIDKNTFPRENKQLTFKISHRLNKKKSIPRHSIWNWRSKQRAQKQPKVKDRFTQLDSNNGDQKRVELFLPMAKKIAANP